MIIIIIYIFNIPPPGDRDRVSHGMKIFFSQGSDFVLVLSKFLACSYYFLFQFAHAVYPACKSRAS